MLLFILTEKTMACCNLLRCMNVACSTGQVFCERFESVTLDVEGTSATPVVDDR